MADWYCTMFPDAEGEDDLVPLYSLETLLGTWEVHAPVRTFRYQPIKEENTFFLFWADEDESQGHFITVYDAIKTVHFHSTGIAEWDASSFEVSDYLLDWEREVPDRVIFNYIDYWIQRNPKGSLRGMVDYFEHDDTRLVDRMNISGFLEEMIISGQLNSIPHPSMSPCELESVVRLARDYGISIPGD